MNTLEMNYALEVEELSIAEMNEIEGGGWIADTIEKGIIALKCACHPPIHTSPILGSRPTHFM